MKDGPRPALVLPLWTLAALPLAPLAHGQGAGAAHAARPQSVTVMRTTRLLGMAARDVPATIRSAQGLDRLTCDFRDNSVTVRGSREAVAAFQKELESADAVRSQYRFRLTARLVRYQVDAQGGSTETVVGAPTVTMNERDPVALTLASPGGDGYTLSITPHGGGDGSESLTVRVQELGEQGEVVCEGRNTQWVTLGHTTRITGMTYSLDRPLRRAVQKGEVVMGHGEYTGYYVEVTPTSIPFEVKHP